MAFALPFAMMILLSILAVGIGLTVSGVRSIVKKKRGMYEGKNYIVAIKLIAGILVLSMLVILVLSLYGVLPLLKSPETKARGRMEQVIAAVETKDKEALRDLFSEEALANAEGLDEQIDALFDYIQGDIESWDRVYMYSSGISSESKMRYEAQTTVYTTGGDYLFCTVEYGRLFPPRRTIGIFWLEVRRVGTGGTNPPWDDSRVGIYVPEEYRPNG